MTKLSGLVKNIRMYDCSKSSYVERKSMAELTYFFVGADKSTTCDTFYVFSDEKAAEMFAASIGSIVETDYQFVGIPR